MDNLPDLMKFADMLDEATLETIESGKMTGDLALITSLKNVKKLNTEDFILAVRDSLAKKIDD
jgi:isocitrate dehydrogenase